MSNYFNVETAEFKGPLESLLDLIESRKLSISDISLAEVADSYLAHVEKLPQLPLSETSQFVLVASTLLLIKSRALLPIIDFTQDEQETVQDLERRLLRLKVIRDAAKLLRREWGRVPLALPARAPARMPVFTPREASVLTIHAAALKLIDLFPRPEQLTQAVVAPVLALEDVVKKIRERLTSALKTRWSDITRDANRSDIIVHFLAILELVRSGSASVTQDALFKEIIIEAEALGAPKYGI